MDTNDTYYVYIAATNEIKRINPCAWDPRNKRFILDPWGEAILNIGADDIVDVDLENLLETLGNLISEEDKEWYRENL